MERRKNSTQRSLTAVGPHAACWAGCICRGRWNGSWSVWGNVLSPAIFISCRIVFVRWRSSACPDWSRRRSGMPTTGVTEPEPEQEQEHMQARSGVLMVHISHGITTRHDARPKRILLGMNLVRASPNVIRSSVSRRTRIIERQCSRYSCSRKCQISDL